MNNLCKKMLFMVLVAAITLGMLPITTYAASTTEVILGGNSGKGITLNSATPYWKNGVTTATSNETDYNVYFNSANGTLTLKGANITDYYKRPENGNHIGIFVESGDLNIILEGTNTVDISNYTCYYITSHGLWISQEGNLTFDSSSTGSLIVKGGKSPSSGRGSFGISVERGTLTINGGTITATGGTATNSSCGILGDTTINGGTITATGGTVTNFSCGICGCITINGGTITATGGTITATGGTVTNLSCGICGCKTINGGTIMATGGTITVTEGDSSYSSSGILGDTTINGGTITAMGNQRAFDCAPRVTGYSPKYVASTNINGSNPTIYDSDENNSYKYLNIVTVADSGSPTVTTNQASEASYTIATLNGGVNPNNASTTVTFQYGLTDGYGTTVTETQSPITGKSAIPVSKEITDLIPNATYHYRVVAENSRGTAYGLDSIFTTLKRPTIGDVSVQLTAVENVSYVDMTQATAKDETYIEAALKAKAEEAVNDSIVTVTVNKISYTEPIAGTSAKPSGTDGSYAFTITVSKGDQRQTSGQKTITITVTPYIAIPTYEISGAVQNEDSKNVLGATVKIMYGQNQVGLSALTDSGGKFKIANVTKGTYNLVVSKDGIIVTTIIVINVDKCAVGTIKLPSVRTNSVVEVIGQETPSIVVDKLNDYFRSNKITDDDNNVLENGGTVEIKLEIEKKAESNATNAVDIKVAAGSQKTIGIFLDLTMSKTVTSGSAITSGSSITSGSAITVETVPIHELKKVLELYIPLPAEMQGKSDYIIYRYHNSRVDTITETVNFDGEYIELSSDGKSIKLYTKKFSTYAIAYTADTNNSSGNNHNSSTVAVSSITADSSKNGKVTISKDNKIVTIIPDDGYVIADVLVDGKSVGATEIYTFTDSKNHKISTVFVEEFSLPYYMQDSEKVFIGFTAIMDKILKYTAPNGVNVEFSENSKSFSDIENHWAKANIDFVTEREIFEGTSKNTFAPQTSMTRAMFVTVVGRLYERSYGNVTGNATFSDVDMNAYYAKYVSWANENGIIKGIGGNKFAPDDEVTREQMSEIMFKFATFLGKAPQGDWMINVTYKDKANISEWAMDSAAYCQLTSIISGRDGGEFAPKATATRAEVSAVIERFVEKILK